VSQALYFVRTTFKNNEYALSHTGNNALGPSYFE
jgi:hypothetical protein